MKRYLIAMLFLWGGAGFAAESSMPMQMQREIPIIMESTSVLPSCWTIEHAQDQWIVTSSKVPEPMVFSHQEMSQILAGMPADSKVLWLSGDWRPVMAYMTEHDIRPQSGATVLSGSLEHKGSASGSDHSHEYCPIMARMRELSSMGASRRITIRSNVHIQAALHSYLRLQAQGKKSELEAERRKLQGELDSAFALFKHTIWSGWAKDVQQRIRALDIVLAQDVTDKLHQILILPLNKGEILAAQLQTGDFKNVGFDVPLQARRVLETRRMAERFQGSLFSADAAQMKEVQAALKAELTQEQNSTRCAELQRRIDRVQSWLDDPHLPQLVVLHEATAIEQAYLIRREMESKPLSRDMGDSIRRIWCQKEGAIDFARLPEAEREMRIESYLAQKIAAEKGLVLDNATLDSSSTGVLQTNSSEVASNKLADVTDMTTDKPTIWYGKELSAEKTALFAAYQKEVHEALIREGVIDRDMPRAIQVADLFIETLAHELHPNQIKRDIDGIAQLAKDVAHSATSPINGVQGRSHLGHPHPRVIAALEAGVGGVQEVARRLVTPMEGVDKSPLVQVLRAAGDLTPEQIAIISAKATADWIKFEALSTVGAYVSQADVLGKVRDVAQRVEKGTLTADEARRALIADGIVLDVSAAESSAASAAESTSVLRNQSDKVRGGESIHVTREFEQISVAAKGLHPELESNIQQIEDLHNAVVAAEKRVLSGKAGRVTDNVSAVKYLKIEEEAARHYEKIRITSDDIKVISRNTGIEESVIQRVKGHVFYEEHILYDGVRKFDPQADMAAAWKRLTDNEFLQSDLILLQHEYVESLIMRGIRVPYSEAHAMADKIYDWYSFL